MLEGVRSPDLRCSNTISASSTLYTRAKTVFHHFSYQLGWGYPNFLRFKVEKILTRHFTKPSNKALKTQSIADKSGRSERQDTMTNAQDIDYDIVFW